MLLNARVTAFTVFLSYQGKTNREEVGGRSNYTPLHPPPPQKKKKEKIWVKLYFCC